jgi:hypothetical protein
MSFKTITTTLIICDYKGCKTDPVVQGSSDEHDCSDGSWLSFDGVFDGETNHLCPKHSHLTRIQLRMHNSQL